MIAAIRMKGKFSLNPNVKTALTSLKLDRLYACTLLPENEATKGMIHSCKDVVAYGQVEKETIALLLAKRGKTSDGKRLSIAMKPEQIKKVLEELLSGKKPSDIGISPVFFLSPPAGGFGKRKAHVPFGPLGKNPEIADLISRMA